MATSRGDEGGVTIARACGQDGTTTASFADVIFEHCPHAVWVADAAGTMVRQNQACRDLMRVRDDEVVGTYNVLRDNVVEEQGHMPAVRAAFEDGADARFTLEYDSGAVEGLELEHTVRLALDVTIAPLLDAAGRVTGAVIQHIDVTTRERVVAELRRQKQELQAVFDTSPVGVYVSRASDGTILDANVTFAALLGRTPEETIGRTSVELGLFEGLGHRGRMLRQLERYGRVDGFEIDLTEPGRATPRTLLFSAAPLDFEGERTFVGTLADITRRKEMEIELGKLAGGLEERVRERTAKLEESVAEIESFAYSVSHDLRAPLRHISGYAGMLAEDYGADLDEQARDYIDALARSAREMGVLIDELLEFSRVGRSALRVEDVDMADLVDDVREELGDRASTGKVAWDVMPLPVVRGDRVMLRLVWENLLSNALKYSRYERRPSIEVKVRETEQDYVFSVADNGVGFDMQYSDQLFNVFQRLHGDERFEGVGIGLANVRRIIARHGGRTWGVGIPDGGAEFGFTLPKGDHATRA